MDAGAAHSIDRDVVRQKNEISQEFLEDALDSLDERPDLLPAVFRRAVQLAGGIVGSADATRPAVAELARGARAAALMFVHAWHGNDDTFISLDPAHDVTLVGQVDPSSLHAPAWNEAMWCALACGDELAQAWLASVPPSRLQAEGVRHARYAVALGEFLRSLVTRDGRHGVWLAEALRAADDGEDAILEDTRGWVDALDYPAMRAAFHCLDRDHGEFEAALAELHREHQRHWSSSENELAVDGLLSLRGCALLRLATQLELQVAFSSGYMPAAVWQAPPIGHPVRCPCCTLPLPARAPVCGPCGREIVDAPLELGVTAAALPRKPCDTCAFPLHLLAVVCPQCRSARG